MKALGKSWRNVRSAVTSIRMQVKSGGAPPHSKTLRDGENCPRARAFEMRRCWNAPSSASAGSVCAFVLNHYQDRRQTRAKARLPSQPRWLTSKKTGRKINSPPGLELGYGHERFRGRDRALGLNASFSSLLFSSLLSFFSSLPSTIPPFQSAVAVNL